MKKPRARDLGLKFPGQPGKNNSLTDIKGVLVGHSTLIHDEPGVRHKPVRTGVTAILPFGLDPIPRPVWAGHFSLNGNGEMTGTHWINDGGFFFGPICITNTHSVGMVHHATTKWMIDTYAENFEGEYVWAMPVVAETYDGVLNDINGQHVTEDHVFDGNQQCKFRNPRRRQHWWWDWNDLLRIQGRRWNVLSYCGNCWRKLSR